MNYNLEEKIIHQLFVVQNLMRRGHHPNREHGHHHEGMRAQRMLLALLEEKNGRSQKELYELMDIRPSSLSELVKKLEKAGLIEKQVNQEDKRASDIFLSEAGKEKIAEISKSRQEMAQNKLSVFSAEEKQTFFTLLAKLTDSLKKETLEKDCSEEHHFHLHKHCGHRKHRQKMHHRFWHHC